MPRLRQRHEVAKLAQFHTRRQVRVLFIPVLLATASLDRGT
jgi:hypothetical protein